MTALLCGSTSGNNDNGVEHLGIPLQDPIPRICSGDDLEEAMAGFQSFGGITTWMCDEDTAMHAVIQVYCDRYPNGIWVAIVHFLEGYI